MYGIDSHRLDTALTALGEQLALTKDSAHLVVIGGSGLLAIDVISRSTQDVDVVALERHGQLVSAEPLPPPIAAAAALVARDLGLEPHWLNPGPTSLLDLGLPDGFADRLTGRDCGPALRVSFASRVDQIYLKLYAAADRRAPRLRRPAPARPNRPRASCRRPLGANPQRARTIRRRAHSSPRRPRRPR